MRMLELQMRMLGQKGWMVEAVGVEPTSGKRVSEASTCVAFYLKSRRARVGRRRLARRPALLRIRARRKADRTH
jgi:hypothetical protein